MMLKRRHYTVTVVLDEVLANSDSDFDPGITDVNNKNSKISVSDSPSSGTCDGFMNDDQPMQSMKLCTFTLH